MPRVFDQKHYETLNASRAAVVSALITELKEPLGLHTALDVGCGLGYFSGLLRSFALDVTAVDGRPENSQEAARRNPGVKFQTYNAEDPAIRTLGTFDLVFCFGLLYHLENPLLAIRHLHSMARQLVLLEAVVFPGDEPVMALVDEVPTEDQGLGHFAFYPTEACLVKMLYRAGFPHVYRLAKMPDHSEYHSSANSRKIRTMLSASRMPIASDSLLSVGEPSTAIRPWDPADSPAISNTLGRLKHFVAKPLPQKIESMKRLLTRNER